MAIAVGSPAPEFTLPDQAGNPVSLKALRGKPVVVYFYPKDNTPGCTNEACSFRDHWAALQEKGVTVLGISPDSQASHAKFAAKFAIARIVVGAILFAAVAAVSHMNPNAILAADEAQAAVALEMVKTMPVAVADAAR